MLAEGADGTIDALLVAHGFDFDLMASLVREAHLCGGQAGRNNTVADHGCGAAGAG
jgi:hypothetical protein